ncbi:hypothetical protein DMB42_11825 [Nonomuraea sp. WAC 01424]|uniref:hypothetical protein n=1 Tax=Nonomuraea sp. WAC 01424 TaxID=2203200 RepID=UPI000F76C5DC|nr:hypothetical protein [Nonomuraea sp. WAC 01424]RSN12859.1 hypothetical protein DMB42_11825 [Nonomuraea sp. WAC 01424]
MKRGNPPQRRTPLKQGKPLERKTPLRAAGNLERKPIRNQSKKRQAENLERRAMKHAMFPDGTPPCIVPWCGQWADDLHEPLTRARGGSITEPDNAVPTCRRHNSELTEEPPWGYELHLLVHAWDTRTYAEVAADRREALAGWHAEQVREAS